MIFIILILVIVSPAFTFPPSNPTHTNIKQQDLPHQVLFDSSIHSPEEKTEIQKPQPTITPKEIVQPIKKKEEISHKVEVNKEQSTVEEKRKMLQPHQQIMKVSDSNPNVQLFQLEPFVSDIIFLGNLRESFLLPFFSSSQIQPLSFVSVKQVRSVNQHPVIATEVTNPVITPTVEPTEEKDIKVDIPTPSIKTPVVLPQPHLSIPLPYVPDVDQIFKKPILKNKKEVQTTKTQNVNDSSTTLQNDKDEQKVNVEEKQNAAEQNLTKPEVQIITVPNNTNVVNPQVRINNQSDVQKKKGEHQIQENQTQYVVPTQTYYTEQLGHNDQIPYQQKVQSQIINGVEEQPNNRQFNIKEEIQKNSQEYFSSDPYTEYLFQYQPYQKTPEVHHIQEVES